jgi:glycosyltransferase involved in cell wall biosynthesis
VVVPCFNEARAIARVVAAVRRQLPSVWVVSDGSTDQTAALARAAGAEVLEHPRNLGKGAALRTGLTQAQQRGFTWAVMMDGDGQHEAGDLPLFLSCAEEGGAELVVGNRMEDMRRMPHLRRFANRFSSWLVSRLAGQNLPDSQCGYRLVNLRAWEAVCPKSNGYEIEAEMLLAFARAGRKIAFVPITTIYAEEQSKFHPVADTWRWLRWWGRQ